MRSETKLMETATVKEVAQWMADELDRLDTLYQIEAVEGIAARFGPEFTYMTESGNQGINKNVLTAFRKLVKGKVEYHGLMRCWVKY